MSNEFNLAAAARSETGSAASKRLRREGRLPAVIYGGKDDAISITLNHDEIFHKLENEAFHTSVLEIDVDGKTHKAILRDVEMHPYKPNVMHLDFQRINAKEKLHIAVPVHLIGAEECPGVKLNHGVASHNLTELDIIALPADIPEYLEADLSALDLGESVHLSDIKLPKGVEIASLTHGGEDLAVATILAVRASQGTGGETAETEEAVEETTEEVEE